MWKVGRGKKQDGTIFPSPLYGDILNQDGITGQDRMNLPHLFKHRLLNWFHSFLLLTETVDTTALPNSIFKCSKYIVMLQAGFLKNVTGRVIFSDFAGLLLWIHVQVLFNMFGNFERIFLRQLWFAASWRKAF